MPPKTHSTSLWVFLKDLCIVSPSTRLEFAAMTCATTKLYKDDQPTAADRQHILGAMKELLSARRKATPGAVVKRLEAKGIPVAAEGEGHVLRQKNG